MGIGWTFSIGFQEHQTSNKWQHLLEKQGTCNLDEPEQRQCLFNKDILGRFGFLFVLQNDLQVCRRVCELTTGRRLGELHQQQPPTKNHEKGEAEKGMLPSAPQLVSATALNKDCVRPYVIYVINDNDNYNKIQEQRSWCRRQNVGLFSWECLGWFQPVCGAEGNLFLPCACRAHVVCLSISVSPKSVKGFNAQVDDGWIQVAMFSLPAGLKGILRCSVCCGISKIENGKYISWLLLLFPIPQYSEMDGSLSS